MKQLLQNYYFRLKKNTLFYTVLAVIVLYLLFVVFFSFLGTLTYDSKTDKFFYVPSEIPLDYLYFNFFSPTGILLLVQVCIVELLSKDYKYDTFRNMLLAGKSRKQVFFSSLIVSLSIYLFFFLLTFILTYGIGSIIGFSTSIFGGLYDFVSFLIYIIYGIALTCFTCFITMVVKAKVGVYGLIIALLFLDSICSGVSSIISIDGVSVFKFGEFFMGYAQDKITYGQLDFAYDIINYQSIEVSGRMPFVVIKNISLDLVITFLSVFFGQFTFSRIDLK